MTKQSAVIYVSILSQCVWLQEGWAAPPILTNGIQCTTCTTHPECALGCSFGDRATNPPSEAWKAMLRPMKAGGSFTITVEAAGLKTAPLVLRRVTFGEGKCTSNRLVACGSWVGSD